MHRVFADEIKSDMMKATLWGTMNRKGKITAVFLDRVEACIFLDTDEETLVRINAAYKRPKKNSTTGGAK